MKKALATLLALSPLVGSVEGELVPGGDFQIYKPGTDYTVTGTLSGPGVFDSYASGVGDGLVLKGPVAMADFADLTSGNTVDLPGWVGVNGGLPDTGKNGVGGSSGLNIFAGWGAQQRIESDAALGTIDTGKVYTISAMVDGGVGSPIDGGLVFYLAAAGTELTPSSAVDVTTGGLGFQVISRTYDATSLAGHAGEDFTIVLGVTDDNVNGGRMIWDDVQLDIEDGPNPFLLRITGNGANLDFEWESQPGMFYVLWTSTDLEADLSTWDTVNVPGSVENNGVFEIATDPPVNRTSISRPGELTRYYRVQEFPLPPVTVLDENFDTTAAGTLPTDWDAGFDAADTLMNTVWEVGDPAGLVVNGPLAAVSVPNCVGTNLTANYGISSTTWLRSPSIDLGTATAATLVFQQWVDIDNLFPGEWGTVRILDATTLPTVTVLAVAQAEINEYNSDGWEEYAADLPTAALGETIVLEFLFESDNDPTGDSSGWYIDDVTLTTPAP